jgi:hypothetical protein
VPQYSSKLPTVLRTWRSINPMDPPFPIKPDGTLLAQQRPARQANIDPLRPVGYAQADVCELRLRPRGSLSSSLSVSDVPGPANPLAHVGRAVNFRSTVLTLWLSKQDDGNRGDIRRGIFGAA